MAVCARAIENELPDRPSKPDASHCRVRAPTDDRRGAGLSGQVRRDYRSYPLVAAADGHSNGRSPLQPGRSRNSIEIENASAVSLAVPFLRKPSGQREGLPPQLRSGRGHEQAAGVER